MRELLLGGGTLRGAADSECGQEVCVVFEETALGA